MKISRTPLPGNISVTPIPIEAPIHTRPVLQSHPYLAIISNITKSTAKATCHHFNWPVFVLFVFFACSLAYLLSKWGWRHFTGRIWNWLSKWDGPLEDLDEAHLLPEAHSEEPETSKITTTTVIPEVEVTPPITPPEIELPRAVTYNYKSSNSNGLSQVELEEWIASHPRKSIYLSEPWKAEDPIAQPPNAYRNGSTTDSLEFIDTTR